jgi:acetyl-CoA acetyltransferase
VAALGRARYNHIVRDVLVAGAAMTRFGKFMDCTIRSLAEEATRAALADANTEAADVGMVFFANATAGLITGQEMIRGQVALRYTGLLGIPIVNVENACASGSSAFSLACMAVGSGVVDVALAVGAEKMTHPDKATSFGAIATAVDLLQADAQLQPAPAAEGKRSFFMDVYAAKARAYMDESGARVDDFARVAVKNHSHGALNPKAQYRDEVSGEEVLSSREISWPLTLLMCSPVGDGAAAVVVCSDDFARRAGVTPVRVRASALVSGTDRNRGETSAVERAATQAYERAGIGPDEIDVVEVHDAAAPAELIAYEQLGLCGRAEGPRLLESGATALGGRVPVNTSGGLLSKGHPIGATGCGQIVELVDQLRGRAGGRQVEGARVALAHNEGGFLDPDAAATVITILSK